MLLLSEYDKFRFAFLDHEGFSVIRRDPRVVRSLLISISSVYVFTTDGLRVYFILSKVLSSSALFIVRSNKLSPSKYQVLLEPT